MSRKPLLVVRLARRAGIAAEVVASFWRIGRWWLIPLVVFLLLATVIVVLAQITPLGPFIYVIF